ncbi:MAG: SsrA-binding protein SmpB [Patescibacteria group bacterium]|nr:SsrA-binding protein SmpB [Patescibacteria group bacterium]
MPNLATNKKALHDYAVVEKFEAGIVLSGGEVKSVKNSQINLKGSYVTIDAHSEVQLIGASVSAYKAGAKAQADYKPDRTRKLLLRKKEIDYLRGKSQEKGLTILPISVYTKGGLIKVELGLVRGKKQFDKRETIRRRETDRQIRRVLRSK